LPGDAVMDRNMFKAKKHLTVPTGNSMNTVSSLLVKIPSPVMFTIVVAMGCQKNKVAAKIAVS